MTIAARMRAFYLKRPVEVRAQAYAIPTDGVATRQLEQLNAAWARSLAASPYAVELKRHLGLPEHFESWQDLDASVPATDRAMLREVIARVPAEAARRFVWRSTGGTTGEPFHFPTFRGEHQHAGLDIWLGRKWLGISPEEPMFLLWGHAHLLGSGVKGAVNKMRRRISDRLLGYTRVSAYDLSEADMAVACARLLSVRPRYVVGYSSALDRFARVNAGGAPEIARLKLKAVIATAEGFPFADSRERVAETFGAPVLMEYGSVETGPLAYERPSGGYDVLHQSHRLSQRGGEGAERDEVLITSLARRALPLLNYAIGDLVEAETSSAAGDSLIGLSRVVGRCNDVVPLPNGEIVHSEAFTHCVRDMSEIVAFQVVRRTSDRPLLRYAAPKPLEARTEVEVRRRLSLISPLLADMPFEQSEGLEKSVAGKHRVVVDG